MVLSYILLAVLAVSLISLIGVITLSVRQKKLENMMLVFVAFAAGTLLGVAFFDLLPAHRGDCENCRHRLLAVLSGDDGRSRHRF